MPIFDKDILIKNINQLMYDNNITQTQLAKDLNVGQPSINKCLNGKQSISIELVYQIAHHFNVSIDDLCRDQSLTPLDAPENAVATAQTSLKDIIISVCTALANIYKSATPRTYEFEIREEVFESETDEYGNEIGHYFQKKDALGQDPVHKYTALYFPNYTEIQYSFETPAEAEEYFCILHECGNEHTTNMYINRFIKKLTDLLNIYIKDSMSKESYHSAIDDNLAALINTFEKK